MNIYLSGPITGHPNHVQEFGHAAQEVWNTGHEFVDPHDVLVFPHDGKDCPPGARNGEDDPHAWPCYLRADIVAMLKCDAILMLPGYEASPGALFELDVAIKCGLPVYLSAKELP